MTTNTPRTIRLASAFASVVITFSLLSSVASMAHQPVGNVLLAQAATTTTIR